MACTRIAPNVIVCGPDGYGEATVNGRVWRWDFHNYLGPTFIKKDGSMLKNQPGENHPVWNAFADWLTKHDDAREKKASREGSDA
jgi:hypothetical protein